MKMITAIVNKEDANAVCNALTKGGFSVTKLSTTGGFLMAGNMTLLIGTDDEKVDKCIELSLIHICIVNMGEGNGFDAHPRAARG